MEFMYLFIIALVMWGFAILGAIKFKFLALPVLVLDIAFLVPQVIANEFPEWQLFFIVTIIITLLFAILAFVGD